MEKIENLTVTTSPHLHKGLSTNQIMWSVILCLIPAGIWGIYVYGLYSLLVILVSITAAVLTEFIITRLQGKLTILDGSAFLTGLLIGYNMPPSIPIYIPIIAAVFAMAVVKHAFGGLGCNWMNPALAGRVFVFFSWSGPMATWTQPNTLKAIDAVSSASPLGTIKAGLLELSVQYQDTPAQLVEKLKELKGPLAFLAEKSYPFTGLDKGIIGWLNNTFGLSLNNGYIDLFLGNVAGCIGEVSTLLLILGAVYLFIRKIITWQIPVSYIVTFGLFTWIFGGLRFARGLFTGDFLFHILAGGLILGALYMATDMVTSPLTGKGMLIFGIGCGFLTFLIRFFAGLPEGVSLAIIIMNMTVPLIDRYTRPRIFGTSKEKNK